MSQHPTATAPEPGAPQKLDDLMLAMDVVDTIRHEDALVQRELAEPRREAELMERLRQIYRGQGIEVPDSVLAEGVSALKESRFVYTPPPPGLARSLATLWVRRDRIGKGILALIAVAVIGAGAYGYNRWRVAGEQREQARIAADAQAKKAAEEARMQAEFGERLPRALDQGYEEVVTEARDAAARERADFIRADGRSALQRRDRAGAQQALADLETLRASLRREYVLRIVSRPNEPSVVWRTPPGNRGQRNYYAIVEAVTPGGEMLSLPILSEENTRTATVQKFGVRIPESTAEEIRRDKQEDGIVQRNRLAVKRRGALEAEYLMPATGGFITQW